MAAAKHYSNLYDSAGAPLRDKILRGGTAGLQIGMGLDTMATTQTDDQDDTTAFVPCAVGFEIYGLFIEAPDIDGATAADIDIVLVDPDAALTDAPLATLWNAGAAFQSAVSRYVALGTPVIVPLTDKGYCNVAALVNTAAGTPQESAVSVTVFGK